MLLEELAKGEFVGEGIYASLDMVNDRRISIGNYKLKGTTPEQIADLRKLKNDLKREIEKDNPDYNISKFDKDFDKKLKTYLDTEMLGSFELVTVPMNDADKLMPIFTKHGYSLYVDGTMTGTVPFNSKQAKHVWMKGYKTTFTEIIEYVDKLMIGDHIELGKKQKVTIKIMCFRLNQ